VAAGLVRLTRGSARPAAPLALSVAALVAAALAWGWQLTPALYAGEPKERRTAREAAEAWLAQTSRASDVLFGYDPLYLGARERGAPLGDTVVPRADPDLALAALLAGEPLGRGVWVLDASEGNRIENDWLGPLSIEPRSPGPEFETRAFGPFLIVRTREPTRSSRSFLVSTARVQTLGGELGVETSGLNYRTARYALAELERVAQPRGPVAAVR
jgi:hypothetical protein